MKIRLFLLTLLGFTGVHASDIYNQAFGGSSDAELNDTPVETGGQTWVASPGAIFADGSIAKGSGSAVLPYYFPGDSGGARYVATLALDHTASQENSTGWGGLYFTTSDPPTPGYVNEANVKAFGTVGFRGNADFELWSGPGSKNHVHAKNLHTDYDVPASSRSGVLRVILDTTKSNWTVDAFFTPLGEVEVQLDLNGEAEGNTHAFEEKPNDPLTGVGFMWSGITVTFQQFSFAKENP